MLDEILSHKRIELAETKQRVSLAELKERAASKIPRSFKAALRGNNIRLIAEVKKASPSRGLLCPDFRPVALAQEYERGGAAAISVLTESKYFQGSLDYLAGVRAVVKLPLLRKDFIFDDYQVYEAAAGGADALLLITAILDKGQLACLINLGRACGLDCLVEVHDEAEIRTALDCGAEIIGINNRDLRTFKVDTAITERLRPLIPSDRVIVAESGIRGRADIERLERLGVDAVLIGEALVTAPDVTARLEELGFGTR